MTESLYTATDVKKVRDKLQSEQQGKDALTTLDIPAGKAVLDHAHDADMFVRGVLHRNVNSALGRIENSFTRDLAWWYPYTLPDFLRQAADYLSKEPDARYRHNSWIKSMKVRFNKLKAAQQDKLLLKLGSTAGTNLKNRKELFAKVVLERNLGYETIDKALKEV